MRWQVHPHKAKGASAIQSGLQTCPRVSGVIGSWGIGIVREPCVCATGSTPSPAAWWHGRCAASTSRILRASVWRKADRLPVLAIQVAVDHSPAIQQSPTDQATIRHLTAADGYLMLGMVQEANDELEELAPAVKHSRGVLAVRARIYIAAGSWELLREVAGFLVNCWPEDAQHWIWLTYGTRRCHSLTEAEQVLLDALRMHATEPMIHFNLACYSAQLGRLDEARQRLERAISLGPDLRLMALDDPDLEPLWAALGKPTT